MSPSFNSFGSNPSVSQLVWDTDLVIPDGMAIESASGEVGIVGDVSVSGNITADANITSLTNLVGVNAVISDKPLLISDTLDYANVTLAQIPNGSRDYTSADFAITNLTENVQYVLPPITYYFDTNDYTTSVFSVQAKLSSGTYQTVSSVSLYVESASKAGSTQHGIIPAGTTALRYTIASNGLVTNNKISSDLALTLTPIPVYWMHT